MSAEVDAVAPAAEAHPKKAAPKKAGSKLKTPKQPASHPPYGEMIKAALVALKEKKGSSRAAILKYIVQNYKVGEKLTVVSFSFFLFSIFFYCSFILVSYLMESQTVSSGRILEGKTWNVWVICRRFQARLSFWISFCRFYAQYSSRKLCY